MSELGDGFDYHSSDEELSDFSQCDRRPIPKRIYNRGTAWTFSDTWEFNVQAISARSFQERKEKAQDEIKRSFLVILNHKNCLMEKIHFVTIVMDYDSLQHSIFGYLMSKPSLREVFKNARKWLKKKSSDCFFCSWMV